MSATTSAPFEDSNKGKGKGGKGDKGQSKGFSSEGFSSELNGKGKGPFVADVPDAAGKGACLAKAKAKAALKRKPAALPRKRKHGNRYRSSSQRLRCRST